MSLSCNPFCLPHFRYFSKTLCPFSSNATSITPSFLNGKFFNFEYSSHISYPLKDVFANIFFFSGLYKYGAWTFPVFLPLVWNATLWACSIIAISFVLFRKLRKYDIEVPRIPPPIITRSKLCVNTFPFYIAQY